MQLIYIIKTNQGSVKARSKIRLEHNFSPKILMTLSRQSHQNILIRMTIRTTLSALLRYYETSKNPKKELCYAGMPVFYFKTPNVNQRKALDNRGGDLPYLLLHRLVAANMEPYSSRAETKSDLRTIPD